MDKYQRLKGKPARPKDRKLRTQIERTENKFRQAAEEAQGTEALFFESSGFLEPENEMEKTFKVTQKEIGESVDVATQTKQFNLTLDQLGPYRARYSNSGNYLIMGGNKGHIASFNWKNGNLEAELQVNETVRAVTYLQNDFQFFAVAQKKYTFIYDVKGTELHKLKNHIEATNLEYLRYHYLLVSAGNTGFIKYQDVSTGDLVSELRTKLGPTQSLCQNPFNGVIHAGHNNGTVTLWAPTMSTPLVKLQTSRGPVRALAVDRSGNYMAAAGADKSVKVWDIRNFKTLESYYSPTPASSLSISDTGLLAVGWGPHVQVWKDVLTRNGPKVSAPYMNHLLPGKQVESVQFCPFEDILGTGHSAGFESIIVPGSGETNIDALEANPYMYATRTGRREGDVRRLLDKLQPDMISLDPNVIGQVDRRSHSERLNAAQLEEKEESTAQETDEKKLAPRTNIRGKNSGIRRLLRKKTQNVIDQRKMRLQSALEAEKKSRERARRIAKNIPLEKETGAALRRFM